MKIAILGATGNVGQRILSEAERRGHQATSISRQPNSAVRDHKVEHHPADVELPEQLESALVGHDAVISAVGPRADEPPTIIVDATRALAAACMRTGVKRVLVVGGAGSLNVEPGMELFNTPDFPSELRETALAHRDALELWLRVKELDWTVISPAAALEAGARTGRYRTGHNDLLRDANGRSRISLEDFAVGVLDELEHGGHLRERITFAY